MSYAQAKSIDRAAIPVIDVSPLADGDPAHHRAVGDALRRAAEGTGFFYVSGHGIPTGTIDRVFAAARAFFARPPEDKQQVAVNRWHHGFIRIGEAKMYDGARADLKESYVWGLDVGAGDPDCVAGVKLIGPNMWPAFMPGLRPLLTGYMEACNALGIRLLRACALSLDIDPGYFTGSFDRPVSRGSLIWYPPQPADAGDTQFGVAPHTDYGCLTLLCQDDTGGLQVMGRDGEWVMAHPIPGTFVVNVGDLLARWTNDRFASTPHRVVNASGRERLSAAVFVDPNHDTIINPVVAEGEAPHYPPVTCAGHIQGRLDAAFAYRNA